MVQRWEFEREKQREQALSYFKENPEERIVAKDIFVNPEWGYCACQNGRIKPGNNLLSKIVREMYYIPLTSHGIKENGYINEDDKYQKSLEFIASMLEQEGNKSNGKGDLAA